MEYGRRGSGGTSPCHNRPSLDTHCQRPWRPHRELCEEVSTSLAYCAQHEDGSSENTGNSAHTASSSPDREMRACFLLVCPQSLQRPAQEQASGRQEDQHPRPVRAFGAGEDHHRNPSVRTGRAAHAERPCSVLRQHKQPLQQVASQGRGTGVAGVCRWRQAAPAAYSRP